MSGDTTTAGGDDDLARGGEGAAHGSGGAQPPADGSLLARLSDNAWVLIVLLVPAALVVGAIQGAATAILVLIAAALISVIALFWASVRTLLGETPLSGADAYALAAPRAEEEQKQAILRALKDLEFERSVGKISAEDYAALVAKYRAEAKRLLRKLDDDARPRRERVEHLVRKRLAEVGLGPPEPAAETTPSPQLDEAGEQPAEKTRKKKKRRGDARPVPEAPAAAPAYEPESDAKARRVEIEPLEAPEERAPKRADRPKAGVDITWKSPLPTKTKESPAFVPPVKKCAECGTQNDPDANFCKKCGSKAFEDGNARISLEKNEADSEAAPSATGAAAEEPAAEAAKGAAENEAAEDEAAENEAADEEAAGETRR